MFTRLLQNVKNVSKSGSGESEMVVETVLELAREGQERLQKSSLECLSSLGLPGLDTYQKRFVRLMGQDTFKSEIVQFDLEGIAEGTRSQVVRVLLSVLFSKLFQSKGKGNTQLNKKVVLGFLSRLRPAELEGLYRLILDYHGLKEEGSNGWQNSSH